MDGFNSACALLPKGLREEIHKMKITDGEEIRLRLGRRPSLVVNAAELSFGSAEADEALLRSVLERATGASLHSHSDTIARGFIASGGLRIGLCGEAAVHDGRFSSFRSISSLCIRIPHECRGAYHDAAQRLLAQGLPNTLIAAPAGGGKTTALREIIRELSDNAVRVGVIDERSEIFASGIAHSGRCTDVISGLGKSAASIMLLRSMNPQLIAMDEISSREDSLCAVNICGCGCSLIATVHGKGLNDMMKRPIYKELINSGAFEVLLTIEQKKYGRTYRFERMVP